MKNNDAGEELPSIEEMLRTPGVEIVPGSSALREVGDKSVGRLLGHRNTEGRFGPARLFYLQKRAGVIETHFTIKLEPFPVGQWVQIEVVGVSGHGKERRRDLRVSVARPVPFSSRALPEVVPGAVDKSVPDGEVL